MAGAQVVVYVMRDTPGAVDAEPVSRRLDALLLEIQSTSGLGPGGILIYPLYPSARQFREDWWRFATVREGFVHGWGITYEGGPDRITSYQIARIVTLRHLGAGIPMLTWGLGDLIADRLAGVDSHAHARLFLERGGLPPIESIVHQLDFSRALPGSYAQSVSFLAFLASERGLPRVIAFAESIGRRWYDFGALFEQHFGMTVAEADRRWRDHLARISAPTLTDAEFTEYREATEFIYRTTLARTPGGLISRPGGAEAYIEALRATDALRRFDLPAAFRALRAARRAGEAIERRTTWTQRGLQVAIWGVALVPILLALLLLAGPSLRSAWRDRRERKRSESQR